MIRVNETEATSDGHKLKTSQPGWEKCDVGCFLQLVQVYRRVYFNIE